MVRVWFLRSRYLVAVACCLCEWILGAPQASAFLAADRWEMPASGPAGESGKPVALTWSIVPNNTEMLSGDTSRLVSFLDAQFAVTNPEPDLTRRPWFSLFEDSFQRWASLGGLMFEYQQHDDGMPHGLTPGETGLRGDIRLAGSDVDGLRGTLASSQLPDSGDVSIDTAGGGFLLDPANNYRRFRNILMHEVGHALGLDHIESSDAKFLMEPELNEDFDGPQIDDIRGLHFLYGDRHEHGADGNGNDSVPDATDLGELLPGAAITIGKSSLPDLTVEPEDTDFVSIARRGDQDFYRFRVSTPSSIDIVLEPAGGRYRQGPEGETQLLYDLEASSNLALTTYDKHGQFLTRVDEALHGGVEAIEQWQLLTPGTYHLRVSGTRDSVQLYALTLTAASMVPEPHAAGLLFVLSLLMLVGNRIRGPEQ